MADSLTMSDPERPESPAPAQTHPGPLMKKVTLRDLHEARRSGQALAMLTCYDYTTARLMHEAGVPRGAMRRRAASSMESSLFSTGPSTACASSATFGVMAVAPR